MTRGLLNWNDNTNTPLWLGPHRGHPRYPYGAGGTIFILEVKMQLQRGSDTHLSFYSANKGGAMRALIMSQQSLHCVFNLQKA